MPSSAPQAAFFKYLRANIRLASSIDPFSASPPPSSSSSFASSLWVEPPDSCASTPDCLRPIDAPFTLSSPREPRPSPHQASDQPPDLASLTTTSVATTSSERVAALDLIVDSVSQQRHLAAQSLIFHPAILALYLAVLAAIHQGLYKGRSGDLALVLATAAAAAAAVTAAGLLGVRWLVAGYLAMAERVGKRGWLEGDGATEGRSEVLVTRLGADEIIGTVVVGGVREGEAVFDPAGGGGGGGRRRHGSIHNHGACGNGNGNGDGVGNARTSTSTTKGTIRAWTVRRQYRRRGLGGALLREAVELCSDKGWAGPVFAPQHANSATVLPGMFNAGFERREARARLMLEAYVDEHRNRTTVGGGGKGQEGRGRRRKKRRMTTTTTTTTTMNSDR